MNVSPAVADGVVYVADLGRVWAIDALSGELLWKRHLTQGLVSSSPAVGGDLLVIGVNQNSEPGGRVDAFDAETGRYRWRTMVGSNVHPSPTVWNGRVYAGSSDGNIYAFDADDGDILWSVNAGGEDEYVISSPAVANGVVYIGSEDRKLRAIDAVTGEVLWRYRAGSWIWSSPAVVDGTVYVGSWDHHLYAFRLPED